MSYDPFRETIGGRPARDVADPPIDLVRGEDGVFSVGEQTAPVQHFETVFRGDEFVSVTFDEMVDDVVATAIARVAEQLIEEETRRLLE